MTKSGVHPILGHLIATWSAALAFVLILMFLIGVLGEFSTMAQIGMGIFFFTMIGFVTLVTAAIPVLVVQTIAERFLIAHLSYYVLCGALTGLVLSPIGVSLIPTWYTDPPDTPPPLEQALRFALISVPSGTVGGFAYWLVTGRFVASGTAAGR